MNKKIYINGKIFTSDLCQEFVEAMAIEGDRIIWTGDTKTGLKLYQGFDIEDLKGCCVIPGLVDAHMHPVMLAEFAPQIACLPPQINSIKELSQKIGQVARDNPEQKWILGWGYDEGKFEEGRSPNRYDLDAGCKDRPVAIIRSCQHIRCVNSKALELAGIDENTPDPEGGEIERDENGIPTGVLKESARNLVLPFMEEETLEDVIQSLLNLGNLLESQGIVAIADMGNLKAGDNLKIYEEAMTRGFKQRVSMYYMWEFFMNDKNFTVPKEGLSPNAKLHIGGLKLIGDGSVSGRTAWAYEPYKGGNEDDIGMSVYSDEEMERAIEKAKELGCQVSIHAMGGRAIDRVLDRIKDEPKWTNGDTPHIRIEHVTEPTLEAMKVACDKGIAFATQPIFMYCEIESYQKNFEEDRIKRAYPLKTMVNQGVQVAMSTDAPATSWAVPSDPFSNIKSAVTRKSYNGMDLGIEEAIDVKTAVRLYTIQGAKVMGLGQVGMLKPGYLANFAVLSQDIFSIEPEKIDEIFVKATYIEGEKIYEC